MTPLLDQAIAKIKELPPQDQDAVAQIILAELESERRWEELFAHPKSADLLSRMADEALEERRLGRTRNLDVNEL
jgi:hypothetical protein